MIEIRPEIPNGDVVTNDAVGLNANKNHPRKRPPLQKTQTIDLAEIKVRGTIEEMIHRYSEYQS